MECDLANFVVTPSQGTYLFQNIITFGVAYLTVNRGEGSIDWEWLQAQPVATQAEPVCHVALEAPLKVILDGRRGPGRALKPEAKVVRATPEKITLTFPFPNPLGPDLTLLLSRLPTLQGHYFAL